MRKEKLYINNNYNEINEENVNNYIKSLLNVLRRYKEKDNNDKTKKGIFEIPEWNNNQTGENCKDGSDFKPKKIDIQINWNYKWSEFKKKPKDLIEPENMKALFAVDCSVSISEKKVYFNKLRELRQNIIKVEEEINPILGEIAIIITKQSLKWMLLLQMNMVQIILAAIILMILENKLKMKILSM